MRDLWILRSLLAMGIVGTGMLGAGFLKSSSRADEPAPAIEASDLAAVKAAEAARIRAIDSVYGAVVAIYGNDRQGGGSGVLFDPAGYALTNHHVVAAAGDNGWAGLADGKLYRWKLIGTDPGGDVAIIQLEGKQPFPTAPLGDSERVRVGDWAMAMGNPFTLAEDQRPTVTLGIVSGVHRFQEGSGLNQLVYGNCIQVDSSINPGNSGGPLFNLAGEVIGINGRGSFQERGRVNVGLGYAISSNQVRLFVPELLATKMAQHGTLDAIFGTRADGVICHTVNLDSPAAKAGLALGDRLVSFEGFAIESANEFTNLISMYPAGWPARVALARDGKEHVIHVRLSALPYEPLAKPMPRAEHPEPEQPAPEKPAEEKPAEAKPAHEKPSEEKPAEKTPPVPMPPPQPMANFGEAGKIRDAALNGRIAREILTQWRKDALRGEAAAASGSQALAIESSLHRGGQSVGRQKLLIASDGRARVEYELDGVRTRLGFDGSVHWRQAAGKPTEEITSGKALLDPHFAQAIVLACLQSPAAAERYGTLALDGADKAQDRLCYRLSLTDPSSEQLFLWLSVDDAAGQQRVELVKAGVGLDDEEPIPSTIYRDFAASVGLALPARAALVRGLAETEQLEIVTEQASLVEITSQQFAKPAE
jgi:serine protease Do